LRGLRRTLLFDLGEHALPTTTLLQVSDLFLSHLHIDHFAGFDRLLRGLLGASRTVRVWGPPGVTAAVRAKLRAYLWNLSFDNFVTFEVAEIDGSRLRRSSLSLRDRFRTTRRLGERRLRRAPAPDRARSEPALRLLREPELSVEVAQVDHGTPCLAYALQQTPRLRLDPKRLAAAGLAPGPELATLKARLTAAGAERAAAEAYGTWQRGLRVAYVTDCGFGPATVRGALAVATGADRFYCEATYPDDRADKARAVNHLTAGQAGALAYLAGARELVVGHMSRRYAGEPGPLVAEAARHHAGPTGWSRQAEAWLRTGNPASGVVG